MVYLVSEKETHQPYSGPALCLRPSQDQAPSRVVGGSGAQSKLVSVKQACCRPRGPGRLALAVAVGANQLPPLTGGSATPSQEWWETGRARPGCWGRPVLAHRPLSHADQWRAESTSWCLEPAAPTPAFTWAPAQAPRGFCSVPLRRAVTLTPTVHNPTGHPAPASGSWLPLPRPAPASHTAP